jgi:glycosyltransferase involved in cell wall biosynthesis
MPTVVHITTVHNPFDNRIFYRECISLANAGYRVVLIAPNSLDQCVNKIRIQSFLCPRNRFGRMTLGVYRALRAAISHGEKIFHFHDPEFIIAGLVLKIMGKEVIYDIHEDNSTALLEREYLPTKFRVAISNLLSKLEQIAVIPFSHVLAERYYSERFPRGHTVLNYARLPDLKQEVLKKRPVNGPARLLYTGNVKIYRGANEHVQILHKIPKAEIFLVGRCEYALAQDLEIKAGKHIDHLHLDGVGNFVPYERIIEYYQRERWLAGLAIFPHSTHTSRKELTKIFEYMMYGLPIICSNAPNLRNIIEKHECGLCVDPKNADNIAEAVQFLVDLPLEAQKMADNGLRAAQNHYHWGTQEGKLISLYHELS